jgi:hypothetical protein
MSLIFRSLVRATCPTLITVLDFKFLIIFYGKYILYYTALQYTVSATYSNISPLQISTTNKLIFDSESENKAAGIL